MPRCMNRLLGYFLVLSLSAGCASKPPKLDPGLRPPLRAVLTEALAGAVECESPQTAQVNPSSSFKYGCFCGKSYPNLQNPRDASVPPLADAERETLISRYYSIKPIDDIDLACRDHDVC